jgi:Mg/Co/Ni transporter MgtE
MNFLFEQRGPNILQIMKKYTGSTQKSVTDKHSKLRGVVTDEMLDELDKRNQERAKKLIKEMGNKWAHHPDNYIKRKDGKVYK